MPGIGSSSIPTATANEENAMTQEKIMRILPHFRFQGAFQSMEELKSGNVNHTYRLVYDDNGTRHDYVLQRINTYAFREPARMMENIAGVTDHLRRALIKNGESPDRRVLEVIRTVEGQPLYIEGEDVWRAYIFITDAFAYDTVDAAAFREVGRGFGNFQKLLIDYPADQLFESIPNFHNTYKRFFQLMRAIDEDKAGRVKDVRDEIEFFFDRRKMLCSIVELIEQGVLPLRVTHNDTKSNNVMLDRSTGKAICVIDLDTVMPGSVLYDYGDAIRFGANTAAEDEPDTSKISLDLDKARAFTEGFMEETNGFLTEDELRRLPLGIKVLTGELAMRFLTDYLDGDLYFKIDYPQHNLVRTRAQIALLRDIERKEAELQALVDALIG